MGLAVLAPRRRDVCFVDIHQQVILPTDLIQVSASPSNFPSAKTLTSWWIYGWNRQPEGTETGLTRVEFHLDLEDVDDGVELFDLGVLGGLVWFKV
jgi:hypothetical protein